jgi:hypothetical protein
MAGIPQQKAEFALADAQRKRCLDWHLYTGNPMPVGQTNRREFFARAHGGALRSLGLHKLRGLDQTHELFVPAADDYS